MVLTLYFVVVSCLVAGSMLLPGEEGGRVLGSVSSCDGAIWVIPQMMLSCIGSTAGVKPRASPGPPCLHPRGIQPRTQTTLPLAKDHPRVPRMPLSPSSPNPTDRRDCCSPSASPSAGHCKEKKGRGGEAESLPSPAFPCSGLHNNDGLNLHSLLRKGRFQASLWNCASLFPDWLLPSCQQLWTAQALRSRACSAQVNSEIPFLCPEGWEQMSAWCRDAFGLPHASTFALPAPR